MDELEKIWNDFYGEIDQITNELKALDESDRMKIQEQHDPVPETKFSSRIDLGMNVHDEVNGIGRKPIDGALVCAISLSRDLNPIPYGLQVIDNDDSPWGYHPANLNKLIRAKVKEKIIEALTDFKDSLECKAS